MKIHLIKASPSNFDKAVEKTKELFNKSGDKEVILSLSGGEYNLESSLSLTKSKENHITNSLFPSITTTNTPSCERCMLTEKLQNYQNQTDIPHQIFLKPKQKIIHVMMQNLQYLM